MLIYFAYSIVSRYHNHHGTDIFLAVHAVRKPTKALTENYSGKLIALKMAHSLTYKMSAFSLHISTWGITSWICSTGFIQITLSYMWNCPSSIFSTLNLLTIWVKLYGQYVEMKQTCRGCYAEIEILAT